MRNPGLAAEGLPWYLWARFRFICLIELVLDFVFGVPGVDDAVKGNAGSDTIFGRAGNDSIYGGTVADSMAGAAGSDSSIFDNASDVISELAGEGFDTVYSSVSTSNLTTTADNIENILLTGDAPGAVGNTGNNTPSGSTGDRDLDGGDGDDLLLGGGGNDDLTGNAGNDTLSGRQGDDAYHVSGDTVKIEDDLGHDTLDASGATGDSHIDLSGETKTGIGNGICHIQGGGSTGARLDVQFLQDRSGSFGGDIATARGVIPGIISALQAVPANSQFGLSSFIDKPVAHFGATDEWIYAQHMALSTDAAALSATYSSP